MDRRHFATLFSVSQKLMEQVDYLKLLPEHVLMDLRMEELGE